jgi:hypothetical protein
MKKKNGLITALVNLVIVFSLFIVFFSRIDPKPDHAGFWFILALGVSIGVALARIGEWYHSRNSNE